MKIKKYLPTKNVEAFCLCKNLEYSIANGDSINIANISLLRRCLKIDIINLK